MCLFKNNPPCPKMIFTQNAFKCNATAWECNAVTGHFVLPLDQAVLTKQNYLMFQG